MTAPSPRSYRDRCPGVLRPWIADDGALIRLRLIGGAVTRDQLEGALSVAEDYGDGAVYFTRRTNIQLRALPHQDACIDATLVDRIAATGLLPAPSHELVRNIMLSPLTGRVGGRADLRPVAAALDAALISDPGFAALPGRFLFCLDDGRGDINHRTLDLGLIALDDQTAQLRIGDKRWGNTVTLTDAPQALLSLAATFLRVRGTEVNAPWHIDELDDRVNDLGPFHDPDARTQVTSEPPPYGTIRQDDGRASEHIAVPEGRLTREIFEMLPGEHHVVTPWRSVLATDLEDR